METLGSEYQGPIKSWPNFKELLIASQFHAKVKGTGYQSYIVHVTWCLGR